MSNRAEVLDREAGEKILREAGLHPTGEGTDQEFWLLSDGTELYWDEADPANPGWAYVETWDGGEGISGSINTAADLAGALAIAACRSAQGKAAE